MNDGVMEIARGIAISRGADLLIKMIGEE